MKLILILLALASTQSHATEAPPTYTEQKSSITVASTQPEFTIQLKANPTTGYSWFLREYENQWLTPTNHQYHAPENKRLMGAPGFETWSFKMTPEAFKVPHQTLIRFVYARPWEKNNQTNSVVFVVSTQQAP
jgi:inhibitor of cysteine peptidase